MTRLATLLCVALLSFTLPPPRTRRRFLRPGGCALFTNWRTVIGPKGMRREHVAFWENALAQATSTEAWQKDLERNFWRANFQTGHKFLDQQAAHFRALWAEIGVTR